MDESQEDRVHSSILENSIDVDMENGICTDVLDDSDVDVVGLSPQKDTFGRLNAVPFCKRANRRKDTVCGFLKRDPNVMSCCIMCNKLFVLFSILLFVCLRPLAMSITLVCHKCSDVFLQIFCNKPSAHWIICNKSRNRNGWIIDLL